MQAAISSDSFREDNVTKLVITVPNNDNETFERDEGLQQGSEISSLEDSSTAVNDFERNDDLIGHEHLSIMAEHLSRSAMMSSHYRRRAAMEATCSSSPYRYRGNQWQMHRSWSGAADPCENAQEPCDEDSDRMNESEVFEEIESREGSVDSAAEANHFGTEPPDYNEEAGSDMSSNTDIEQDDDDHAATIPSISSIDTDSPNDDDTKRQEEPPSCETYRRKASDDSKYENYNLLVDPNQGDRSVEIELYSFARPHMRAFHLAWIAFFVAFFTWFAITPLLSEVASSLKLDRRQVWTSSTFAVAGSAVTRILIGPVCDKYGARWAMSVTLVLCAIPTALLGLVNSGTGLNISRLVIGVAGSAFVTSQYWTSSFFTWEVAGTANALVAGWGNLGGGVTQIVMGTLLFPLFKIFYGGEFGSASTLEDDDAAKDKEVDRASDLAWRTVFIFPALLCLLTAFCLVKWSEDSPKGNYSKLRREGLRPSVSAWRSLQAGLANLNTWVLMVQYGCCFGVEITMVNAAALYFKEEFGQSTESAAAIASIFGWMNLFARGVGGFASDMSNANGGMRGRLIVQTVTLVLEGVFVIVFSETQSLGGAIAVMVVFSIFVQAAEGSTYGVVPYVNPVVNGVIAGTVGAGGNLGGVGFSLLFRENAYRTAFKTMGYIAMGSAALTPIIRIDGHRSLLFGADAPEVQERRLNHSQQMGDPPSVLQSDESRRSRVSSSQLRVHTPDDATSVTSTAV